MAAVEFFDSSIFDESTTKAYYRFTSGALTTDSKDTHTLTAISDPAEDASGKFAGAVALDGNDAYSASDGADFKPTGAFTIGGWFKSSSANDEQVIFQSYSEGGSKLAGIILRIKTTKLYFRSAKNSGAVSGTDWKHIQGGTAVNDGAWRFVVATWNTTHLNLYLNGSTDAAAVAWSNAPAYQATNYVRVGCENDTGTNLAFFVGSFDDVFVINGKALSATEVSNLFNGITYPQTLTDVVTIAEVIAKSETRILTDVATIVDTVAKRTSRTLSDVVTVVDTILKQPGKILSEAITIVENFVGSKITPIIISDVVTIAETFTRNANKVVADVITIAESTPRNFGRIMSEVVTLVDTFTKQPSKIISEVVTIAESFIKSMGRVVTDVVAIAETTGKQTGKVIGDVVTIVENFSEQRGRTLSEVVVIVDGLGKSMGRVLSEVITIAESFAQEVKKLLTLTETISITDTITKLFNYIGRLPAYISALVSPKPVGIFGEKDKPGIGMAKSVDSPTGTFMDKDKPGIGVAHSVDKPERV